MKPAQWTKPKTLLSTEKSNLKFRKSTGQGYRIYGLSLAPASLNGVINICPSSSIGCRKSCLCNSGFGYTGTAKQARLNKTNYMINDTPSFVSQLKGEILAAIKSSERNNEIAAFRLNVMSDIGYENGVDDLPMIGGGSVRLDLGPCGYKSIPQMIVDGGGVVYDYTKRIDRIYANKVPEYHLTFSRTEDNDFGCEEAINCGHNIATVFRSPNGFYKLPGLYNGYDVIDGDLNDLRFLDQNNCVVGLKEKGFAKENTNNFVTVLTIGDYTVDEIDENLRAKPKRKWVKNTKEIKLPYTDRVCPECRLLKNLVTGYYKNNGRSDGHTYLCRECHKEYMLDLKLRRADIIKTP